MRIVASYLAATFVLLLCLTMKAQTELTGNTLNVYRDTANTVMPNSGSAAFGRNNTVPVGYSYAFGERNIVGEHAVGSFAVGALDTLTGSHAVSIGAYNTVSSQCGMAFGRYLYSTGTFRSFVIGEGLGADARLGTDASDRLLIGFLSTRPTLTVTGSSNDYSQGILDKTGKVGIGDVTPTAKLHIVSDAGEDAGLILEPKQPGTNNTFVQLRDGSHRISVNSEGEMSLVSDSAPLSLDGASITLRGKVGVNIDNETENYALAVDGGIITTEIHIQRVNHWPDYVFDQGYRLMPLPDLRRYVENHRHLPGLPSEEEANREGYDMGEVQSALLQKIEELTLYTLRQQEEIEMLKKALQELKEERAGQ